ncbi:MAG: DUF4270 family protein [Bacteroidales bacterium]|nr:DUF4270 family protein [Bacteroidales bacterium]
MNKTKSSIKVFVCSGLALLMGLCAFTACNHEDTDMGLNLNDPEALYNGTLCDTLTVTAYTCREDSMTTSNYQNGVIGVLQNSVFGKTEAVMYTQAALSATGGINFTSDVIDSVVLSLAITDFFSTTAKDSNYVYTARMRVIPLADPMYVDSTYYACSDVQCLRMVYFDSVLRIKVTDTAVHLKLNSGIRSIFENRSYSNNDDFQSALHGLKIILEPEGADADNMMMTINYAASYTGLSVHYHSNNDTLPLKYTYVFSGASAAHFNGYRHTNYASPLSVFNTNVKDSVQGTQKLYLQPLGGTFVKMRFPTLKQWSAQHPNAVVHHAQIILPVADESSALGEKAARVLCYKYQSDGKVTFIPDMMDALLNGGFDGNYDKDKKQYRMRVSRQIQQAVTSPETDYGLAVYIDARRISAKQVILAGTDKTLAKHVKLEIIYTETK